MEAPDKSIKSPLIENPEKNNYWKILSIVFAVLFIICLAYIFLLRNKYPAIISVFNSYPTAIVSGPQKADIETELTYTIKVPGENKNNTVSSYWGYEKTEGHQDSWNQTSTIKLDNNTFKTTMFFNTPGTYWIMANVNGNTDTNKKACTGNPTYTDEELSQLNVKSCGPSSFLKVTVIDPMGTWKTYTNPNMGISFKYPSDWNLSEGEKTVSYVHVEKDPDMRTVVGACPGYSFTVSTFDKAANYERYFPIQKGEFNNEPVDLYEKTDQYGCYNKVIFINEFPSSSIKPKLIISLTSKKTRPVIFDQILSTFTDKVNSEGEYCGGIKGLGCPQGYVCKLDGAYPDAPGKCVIIELSE